MSQAKWKKIGSVNSGDEKSNRSARSRSKDEPNQSFSQSIALMRSIRAEGPDIVDSQNTYFCQNFINKRKTKTGSKSFSKLKSLNSINSQKERIIMKSSMIVKPTDSENQSRLTKKQMKTSKQSELKFLKEDHERLKTYVKEELQQFKKDMQKLTQDLKVGGKHQDNISSGITAKKTKISAPISKFRSKDTFLDSATSNVSIIKEKVDDTKKFSQHKSENVLSQIIKTARLGLEQIRCIEQQRSQLLGCYSDLNLQELLL